MKYAIGVDIGGTKTAIAAVDERGVIVSQSVIPTNLQIRPQAMIAEIQQEISRVIEESGVLIEEIAGIGIGAPGPLDSKNGLISCPPNLPAWVDIPVRELIGRSFSVPVLLENDANAAALAEKWIGAAVENENFIYITVSTGIGAGIIAEGKLLKGLKGNAGDIGHMVIDPSFGECVCGQWGCLESIASGTAIAKRASAIIGREVTAKDVFRFYKERDPDITGYMEDVFNVLGVASVSMINTFDPEKIVFGGGVSKFGEPMFDSIRQYVRRYALNPTGRKTEITAAKLGQNAGVIGAAALCFQNG
ncbi:ROK family protein [Planococcus beijingensis]|uniref:ROK family protein n=1 Tax=Planococcus beijingensis TaxID=2782551 RepID=UPI00193C6796|nr:ROK family protein [Planococcus beijingensis]